MRFSIREATNDDAEFVMDLFATRHVRQFAHGPDSVDVFLERLRRARQGNDYAVLIVECDGQPFGNVNFTIVNGWLMEIHVIAFKAQRTGAGLFTMTWLQRRGFNELGVHRMFLEVAEANTGARALYECVGFSPEGCYRDGYRADDGAFHNLIPYGLLAHEPRRAG